LEWSTIGAEIKRRGLDFVKDVMPAFASAFGIALPNAAGFTQKAREPKIPSFSDIAKGLDLEGLKDKLNGALADFGITVDLGVLKKLAGDQLQALLNKVDALLTGAKNNPLSPTVGGTINKAIQEDLVDAVKSAYAPTVPKAFLSDKMKFAKTDEDQLALINEALKGIGQLDDKSFKALGDGLGDLVHNIDMFERSSELSDKVKTSDNIRRTEKAKDRIKAQLTPFRDGAPTKAYTSAATNAGYGMAEGVYNDFTKGISAFLKGQVKGKDAMKSIVHNFTSSIIDTVVGGFTRNLFGPDSVIYAAISKLGRGLFDTGESGGSFFDDLLKPKVATDPSTTATVTAIKDTSGTQVFWLTNIYNALMGIKGPSISDISPSSYGAGVSSMPISPAFGGSVFGAPAPNAWGFEPPKLRYFGETGNEFTKEVSKSNALTGKDFVETIRAV